MDASQLNNYQFLMPKKKETKIVKKIVKKVETNKKKIIAPTEPEEELPIEGEDVLDPDLLEEGMLEEDINPFADKYEE